MENFIFHKKYWSETLSDIEENICDGARFFKIFMLLQSNIYCSMSE